MLFNIPFEYLVLIITLTGIIIFHSRSTYIAILGLITILLYKSWWINDFSIAIHFLGDKNSSGEWKTLLNIFILLLGFSILSKHFEDSQLAHTMIKYFPPTWKGCLGPIFLIFILSSFLDNIAAAMIGGSIAYTLFKGKVHIIYLAGIIGASNAGGAGSVLGDTTTTMIWIHGISALKVLSAYLGSCTAIIILAIIASLKQHRYQPIVVDNTLADKLDLIRVFIVTEILLLTVIANWLFGFPSLGVAIGIVLSGFFRKIPWSAVKSAMPGTIFLISLVYLASLMPVEKLPAPSWQSVFGLGFISAFFDNIPLTKLCLEQGGYNWGLLAFAVGYGGSTTWFGSSAGVALSAMYPQMKLLKNAVQYGWPIFLTYCIGFFIMLFISSEFLK